MKKYSFIFVLALIFSISFFPLYNIASAEMTEAQIQEQEAKWRAELAATEAEIAKWEGVLSQTKKGTASLQNDAAVLQAKINEAKAFIKKRQVQIE